HPAVAEAAPAAVEETSPASTEDEKKEEAEQQPRTARGMGRFLEEMMKDPELIKMMRDQQKGRLDSTYAVLLKPLGLSPEDAETFKNLLLDRQMGSAELMASLGQGELNESKMRELMENFRKDREATDVKLRGFLGNDRYTALQDYERTSGDRNNVNQFNQRFANSSAALDEYQKTQLIHAMSEERQSFPSLASAGNQGRWNSNNWFQPERMARIPGNFSPERAESYLQEREQFNTRVLDRARLILTPQQFDEFRAYQDNQIKDERARIEMARRFRDISQQVNRGGNESR
ncbi:MAG: hypothetical protein HY350_01555, partial [Candidatus Omnitrophica bacterium]|nr:hypothetical protein [Candidatus Omnitrophota bacterium]